MYLAQLSFAELVISFSTWQVEQKRIGQEDFVHLLCSIPDIWGRGEEPLRLSFPLCYTIHDAHIREKVDPD